MLSENIFSMTEHLQTTAPEFLQNDIDKFEEYHTNESTKNIHIQRKKVKHGTEGNEVKCQAATDNKVVGCFCRGARSLMFGRILNTTLPEKVSTTGVTQENLV